MGPPQRPEAPCPSLLLQLAILGANFTCHAASSHLATLTEDVMDHFRRGHFQGFTDLSLAASWNQVRQGVLVVHTLRH